MCFSINGGGKQLFEATEIAKFVLDKRNKYKNN